MDENIIYEQDDSAHLATSNAVSFEQIHAELREISEIKPVCNFPYNFINSMRHDQPISDLTFLTYLLHLLPTYTPITPLLLIQIR